MANFLLDTMVLSESFKPRPYASVMSWIEPLVDRALWISVLSVGEISRGVRKLEGKDKARAAAYASWLETILIRYDGRILPITVATMRIWGPLTYRIGNTDPDLLIAATALEHGLTLVTRNVRHFEQTGVKLLNPYE